MADQSKTEKATPERRRKAREEGQFARGRDAGGVAATAGVLAVLLMLGGTLGHALFVFATRCFSSPHGVSATDSSGPLFEVGGLYLALAVPPALAACIASMAIGFAEAGFHPKLELAFPNFGRIDPLSRLGSLFSPQNAAVEIVLSVVRVGAVAVVAYVAASDMLPKLIGLARGDVVGSAAFISDAGSRLVLECTLALGALSAADYAWNRYKIEKQLMMSLQEVKDEHKQQEGDPRLRARMRQRAREMLRKGIAKAVPKADVVVVNPTHVAVALRYRPKDGAPVVLAKGYDEIALYIRTLARASGVPILENKPLARALAARVKVGKAIPGDLYGAVAEVLAFVYRLRRRGWQQEG